VLAAAGQNFLPCFSGAGFAWRRCSSPDFSSVLGAGSSFVVRELDLSRADIVSTSFQKATRQRARRSHIYARVRNLRERSGFLLPLLALCDAGSLESSKDLDSLPPLPPLPPLEMRTKRRRQRRVLSWATVLAVASAVAFGIVHGLGTKIADEAWPHIKSIFVRDAGR
jgi:hypothetical protein